MSWQTYIDDHLMCDIDGNHLTAAAILGHDGSVWAQSPSFPQFKPEEITAIINDFNEPGSLAPTGLFVASTKYMVIQGEPGAVIRGKKVNQCDDIARYPNKCGWDLIFLSFGALSDPIQTKLSCKNIFIVKGEISSPGMHNFIKGSGGITIKKTGQALIFGIYEEPLTPGQCNMVVERLGDYLIDQGM